jgi:hypothetical protein
VTNASIVKFEMYRRMPGLIAAGAIAAAALSSAIRLLLDGLPAYGWIWPLLAFTIAGLWCGASTVAICTAAQASLDCAAARRFGTEVQEDRAHGA